MMFIKLTFVGGTDTYVSVNHITRMYETKAGTYVCFHGDDDYIVVKETPEEIYNRIQKYRGEL